MRGEGEQWEGPTGQEEHHITERGRSGGAEWECLGRFECLVGPFECLGPCPQHARGHVTVTSDTSGTSHT